MNTVKSLTAPECDRRHGDEDNSRKVKRVALIIANEAVADVAAIPAQMTAQITPCQRVTSTYVIT
jgi:hypothetical protein